MLENPIPNDQDAKLRPEFFAAAVIATLVVSSLLAANIPLKYVERERQVYGAFRFSGSHAVIESEMPTMGGWPMRFFIQYPGEQHARYFSKRSLLGNCSIAIIAGLAVFWMVRFRERKISKSSNRRRTQRGFDILLAAAILLVPMAFLGTAKLSSERQQRVLETLPEGASVELSCWYPRLIANKIPSVLHGIFLKPRGIEFIRANIGEKIKSVDLTELIGLSFYRSEIPSEFLQQFSSQHHLSRLSLVSQTITAEGMISIASLQHIKRLVLNRNGLKVDVLNQLSHWNKLTSVNLRRNTIELSRFSQPIWSKTVTGLSLSRPRKGISDELTIENWPQLRQLSIRNHSTETNDSTLTVRLANLPKLDTLLIDRYQKHNLEFSNLPELESFDDLPDGSFRMSNRDVWIPNGCWVESVRLLRLPRFSTCSFFTRDLLHFEIDETTNCDLIEFSSELISSSGWIRKQVDSETHYQTLIDVLGKSRGPKSLVFRAIPLRSLDLSPLVNNAGVQRLSFLGCGIDAKQVHPQSPMDHLVELNLGDSILGDNQLRRLLLDYPNLEELRASGMELQELHLVEPNQLEKLHLDRLGNVDSLRMIDQHSLCADVRCINSPETLIIKNSESLLGIVLEKPLKPGASISGLRNLEWFAAGGPEVNDQIVQPVLMCPDLDRLTLAYPNLSRAMLQQIGQATHLTALIIPGAGIDQEVTDAWQTLQSLWEINLDESEIGSRTIRWLGRNKSLRSASFARAKIDASGLKSLSSLNRVVMLSLSEVAVVHSDIAELLTGDSLEYLDLSGCQIDDEMMRGLASSHSLRAIKLHRCDLQKSQIDALQVARPKLRVITEDEPMQLKRQPNTMANLTNPVIGMDAWKNSGVTTTRKSEGNVFRTGATPASEDTLDLDEFRSKYGE